MELLVIVYTGSVIWFFFGRISHVLRIFLNVNQYVNGSRKIGRHCKHCHIQFKIKP